MKQKKIPRWLKISGILVLTIGLGLFAFRQFLQFYIPKIIRNQINHLVVEGSDSLYTCSIEKISVNLLTGTVVIKNLNIAVDSTRYRERVEKSKLPNLMFRLQLEMGMIKGLKLYPLVFQNKTIIHTIIADGADLSFSKKKVIKGSKPKGPPSEMQLWNIIKYHIKGIYVERILLNGIKLSYKSLEKNKYIDFSYESCSASFRDIRIDSAGAVNGSRILFTQELTFRLTGVKYLTQDSIYFLKVDTFTYWSLLRKVRVQGLSMHPTLSPEVITARHGMQLDVADIDLPELRVNNFKVERIISNNEIGADTILVQEPLIKIHRDRTFHFDTSSQLGKFPLELLASTPFILRIPLVIIDDAEVHYLERQRLSHIVGDAGFYHVSGTVSNITNLPADIQKNNRSLIRLTGFFMENARLEVNVDFILESPEGDYSVDVHLGLMDVATLNKLVVPFANVRMKSMRLREGHFSLTGNKRGTVGKVIMRYEDLKMEVLKVDPKSLEVKEDNFKSFMANLIAVRHNNPDGKKEVIATNVVITRKRRQPFSHIIFETFVEGSKKVILKVPANNIKVEM
jgi:hypothetical protein